MQTLLFAEFFQPLTDPLARPAYTCFWNTRNTIRGGSSVSSTPAQMMLYCDLYGPEKEYRAVETV